MRYHTLQAFSKQETNTVELANKSMEFTLSKALDVAKSGARSAGTLLREMLHTAEAREKAPKDLVTDADIAAQKILEDALLSAFPTHAFLGEESGEELSKFRDTSRWTWIVDPLDGTANYVHRLPNFAVSIGLVLGDRIQVGVVYDPMADELYSAIAGRGAELNGNPIRVSGCRSINEAMVAASFPPDVQRHSPEVHQFLNVLERSQSIRRLGSAALNLCYVAQGRLDAYWANRLKPWDLAGGILIATEAGARVTSPDNTPIDIWRGDILASSSPSLHQAMLEALGTP